MKYIVLALFLILTAICYSPVLVSAQDFVKIVGHSPVSLNFKQMQIKSSQNHQNQAKWISFNNLASHLYRNDISLESMFVSDCPGKAQLYLTTQSLSVTTYLNGVKINQIGSYSLQLSSAVKLLCGVNNLTLLVTLNKQKDNDPDLLYSITQNQSHCYICQTQSAYYNRDTCSCQCSSKCQCEYKKNKIWLDYPICACPCKNEKEANCKGNFYFDHKRCKCMCKKQYCVPGYRWNRYACKCIKKDSSQNNTK